MRKNVAIYLFLLFLVGIMLNTGGARPANAQTAVTTNNQSVAGAPIAPNSSKENRIGNRQKSLEWETRFFDKQISGFKFKDNQFRLLHHSGIPLKSPGKFPGIVLGVEMHSFQALQSVVPPEKLSKSLNSEQNQPLVLSPSLVSPDYNGGFLRFIW